MYIESGLRNSRSAFLWGVVCKLVLKYNQIIKRYGQTLKIVSLPGNTNGSIGVLYKDYLFVGDALVNRWNGVEIAFQNQDCEEAISSYNKIMELNPNVIFLGHDREIICDN